MILYSALAGLTLIRARAQVNARVSRCETERRLRVRCDASALVPLVSSIHHRRLARCHQRAPASTHPPTLTYSVFDQGAGQQDNDLEEIRKANYSLFIPASNANIYKDQAKHLFNQGLEDVAPWLNWEGLLWAGSRRKLMEH